VPIYVNICLCSVLLIIRGNCGEGGAQIIQNIYYFIDPQRKNKTNLLYTYMAYTYYLRK